MPKDYHKYTTNRHPNPHQQGIPGVIEGQPQPSSKFRNRPSGQHQLRDHGSGKFLKNYDQVYKVYLYLTQVYELRPPFLNTRFFIRW